MINIRKKDKSLEGGNRSYFLLTNDFSSLQARLTSIDTYLNKCPNTPFGQEDETCTPDDVLYSIYKNDSEIRDLHSMTGFSTFVDSIKMPAVRVHDDSTNKDYVFAPTSKVKIKRDGEEKTILAQDLKETDILSF